MANDPAGRPLLLGIEIGGTKLQVGLGRRDGALVDLERLRVDPDRGAGGILAQIPEAADRLLQRSGATRADLGVVGIGFGGPVDVGRGVVIVSNQVEGWANFPLADWTRRTLGVKHVVLGNDADTAALGEARSGAGVGHNPVLYLTIGSGIGGGLVVDGAIYRGSGRGAIEIGHLLVPDLEKAMTTVESLASGWSIARQGRDLVGNSPDGPLSKLCGGQSYRVTAELVAQAAIEGDPGAGRILAQARTALAQALAHAITLLAPQRVILGGGVSMIGEEHWFEPIRLEVEAKVFPPFKGTYDIVPASLGEEVVVHGALALASDTSNFV